VQSLRTVGALLRYGARRFRRARLAFGHGTSNAADEAAWLVSHVLREAPDAVHPARSDTVSPAAAKRILGLFDRRIRERLPAAYLTREAWLGDLRFYVDQRAIVPRSHIAALLREGLEPWTGDPERIRSVLDLCTGSGSLAILAARAFARARIDAADISREALAVARRNVSGHRLGRRIRLIESDLFAKLRGRRYDLIVCNPPYVTTSSMRRLPPEYRHEPRISLAGGVDGLGLVRRVIAEAGAHLKPRGLMVVEVGRGRRRVERAFPAIRFIWPDAAPGSAAFVLEREALARQ
jgi:ribosomal protein L3 glutamine methyltransferase